MFLLTCCIAGFAVSLRAEDVRGLVDWAGTAETMFGRPEVYDSLLAEIAAGGKPAARELLDLADTPWGWRFAAVRDALELIGDPAREEIIARLAMPAPEPSAKILLALLEMLGRSGDESVLRGFLCPRDPSAAVLALRCLAAFGDPDESFGMVLPLLSADDSHLRLAAAWTAGKLIRRRPGAEPGARVISALRRLLDDPVAQVGITAADGLAAAGESDPPGLVKRGLR